MEHDRNIQTISQVIWHTGCFIVILFVLQICAATDSCAEDRILFSSYVENKWELMTIRPDGSGLSSIKWVEHNVRSPAVAVSASLEIAAVREDRTLQHYLKDNASSLVLPSGIYAQPAWNNDGTALAYVLYKVKPSDMSDIWQVRRDANNKWREPERLSAFPPMRLHPSYSPDGTVLLYTEFHRDRLLGVVEELGIYSFKEKSFYKLTTDQVDSFYGRWSPDGKQIAYVSNKSGNYDIWLLTFQNPGSLEYQSYQLTHDVHFDGEPTWSPDGRQLAFVSTRTGSREIWVISREGSALRQVTRAGKTCKEPVWY